MEGVPTKDFSDKSGDVSINDYAVKDKTIIFPRKGYEEADLTQLAADISNKAADIINQYRQVRNVSMCNLNYQLLEGAHIRAKEVLTTYSHLRPNGEEGMDIPYEYGYPRWNEVTREVIGAYETESIDWLRNDAAQAVLDLFLQSVPNFLADDASNEHAVGIHITFDGSKYHMGISYICAEIHAKPEPKPEPVIRPQAVRKPEPLRKPAPVKQPKWEPMQKHEPDTQPTENLGDIPRVDKRKLVYAYNLSNFLKEQDYYPYSWTDFMVAKGEAKQVYKDKFATQRQVDSATAALNRAIDELAGNTIPKK